MMERIQNLWQEVRDLNLGAPPHIDCLPSPPTPLHFLRHYVTPNKPCLVSAAVPQWPALSLWPSAAYLRETLASTVVSLHLTPTGKADALAPHPTDPTSRCFASAHVEKLPFPEALDLVMASDEGNNKTVGYLQQQNDCFRGEYGQLAGDCEEHVPWASEALGLLPEAVNLWIGNNLSETSFHKDHYENLYVVITGEKRFLLLPPTDVHRMYIREYPAARYIYHQVRFIAHIANQGSIRVAMVSEDVDSWGMSGRFQNICQKKECFRDMCRCMGKLWKQQDISLFLVIDGRSGIFLLFSLRFLLLWPVFGASICAYSSRAACSVMDLGRPPRDIPARSSSWVYWVVFFNSVRPIISDYCAV